MLAALTGDLGGSMRVLRSFAGVIVLLVLTTGCLRVDARIVVGEDGSGTFDLVTAINADVLVDALADFGDLGLDAGEFGSAEEICDQFSVDTADLPANAAVTPYDEDGFCGLRAQIELPPATDHGALLSEVFGDPTDLFQEGENWFFSYDLGSEQLVEDFDGLSPHLLETLFADTSIEIEVQLPGEPVEGAHNATSVAGNTFTWQIDLLTPPNRLFAQTEPGVLAETGSSTDMLLRAGLGLIALGAGMTGFGRRRRRPDHIRPE